MAFAKRVIVGLIVVAVCSFAGSGMVLAAGPKKAVAGKRPAASAAVKKAALQHDAELTYMVARQQAEGLVSCGAFKSQLGDLISADTFAAEMVPYMGRLSDLNLEKGEYETTAEHQEKIMKVLGGYVGDPERVVFTVALDGEHQSYNADQGTLTISLPILHFSGLSASYSDQPLLIDSFEKTIGTKRGQTALGVKFNYDEVVIRDRYAVIDPKSSLSETAITLSVDTKNAIAMKDSLDLVVLGSMRAPFYETVINDNTPSLDYPYYEYKVTEGFYISARCAYIYDRSSKVAVYTFME